MYTYHVAKLIFNYLNPLRSNEYTIKSLPPLNEDEEDTSYDVQSLFTNIPVEETINSITDQI